MNKIILTFLVCCYSFLISAADSSKYSFSKISKEEVYNFLYYTNSIQPMMPINIGQLEYCVPTESWIKDIYVPYLKEFLFKNGAAMAVDPDNNCVKFSNYAQTAGYLIHLHGEGPKKSTIAIGTVDYVKNLAIWHSINIFLATDSKGNLKVVYFEPQTQTIIKDINDWIMVRL